MELEHIQSRERKERKSRTKKKKKKKKNPPKKPKSNTTAPPWPHAPVVVAPGGLILVKDAVALVQVAELGPQVVVHIERLYRLALHGHIPNLGDKQGGPRRQ